MASVRIRRSSPWLAALLGRRLRRRPSAARSPRRDAALVRIDTAPSPRSRSKAAPCLGARSSARSRRRTSTRRSRSRALQPLRHELSQQLCRPRLRHVRRRDPGAARDGRRGAAGRRRRAHGHRGRRQPPAAQRRRSSAAWSTTSTAAQHRGRAGGLSFLQNDPLVERVNAELVPGDARRERARVGVTERKPFELAVFAATIVRRRSASIAGASRLSYRGLVGNGDVLSGRFGVSDGADDNALYYHVPLTPGGTALDIAPRSRTPTSSRSRSTRSTSRAGSRRGA